MKREEAVQWFEDWLSDYYDISDIPDDLTPDIANMALSALRAQQEQDHNAPLTLDELRQMEGEPVWTVGVSYTKDGTFSMWDIIESVDENGVQFGRSCENPEWWNYGRKTLDGKLFGWLAYRRKPKEESHG